MSASSSPALRRAGALIAALALLAAWPCFAADAAGNNETTEAADTAASSTSSAPVKAPEKEGTVSVEESAESLSGALQGKEGVRIQTMCTHCNSANIAVGGLAQDLVPMERGGFPLIGGLATSFVLSVLPADTVAEVKVDKGPGMAALPATSAGGTISLKESKPTELPMLDVHVDSGSNGLLAANARLAGSLTDWLSASVVAGKTVVDVIDDDEDGWNDTPEIDRKFAELGLLITPSKEHTFQLGGTYIDEENIDGRGGFDVISRLFSMGSTSPFWTREDAIFELNEYRAGWTWRMDSGASLSLKALTSTRDQAVASQLTRIPDYLGPGSQTDRLFNRFVIEDDNDWAGLTYTLPVGLEWLFEAGASYREQEVKADSIEILDLLGGSTPEPETAIEKVETTSAFAQATWIPSQEWNLEIGARWDDTEWSGQVISGAIDGNRSYDSTEDQVSPRATLRYFPSPDWTLEALYGETFRSPKPILSEVCCGQTYQVNEFVEAEQGQTLGLRAQWQPSPTWKAAVYAASTDFENHILRVVGWSQFYIQTYGNINVPDAKAETAEFAITYKPTPAWNFDASISWLSFHNEGDQDVVMFIAPPSFSTPRPEIVRMDRVPYAPTRTGSVSAAWSHPRGWGVNASAAYTGTMLIQQYADDPFSATNILLPDYRETPGFWIVSLGGSFPINRWLEGTVGVENLTDRLQTDLGDPTTDYNWGPLVGRSFRVGLRFHLDGRL